MLFFQQIKLICVSFYELQFLLKNKFLKTKFITQRSLFRDHYPYDQEQEKLFYVQNYVKKMFVTANIYYINISRKKYLFYNYKYL